VRAKYGDAEDPPVVVFGCSSAGHRRARWRPTNTGARPDPGKHVLRRGRSGRSGYTRGFPCGGSAAIATIPWRRSPRCRCRNFSATAGTDEVIPSISASGCSGGERPEELRHALRDRMTKPAGTTRPTTRAAFATSSTAFSAPLPNDPPGRTIQEDRELTRINANFAGNTREFPFPEFATIRS